MNILTKMALGVMGSLKPHPVQGNAQALLVLPPPRLSGGLPLMQALALRQSQREFSLQALNALTLSDLLWAACGINRKQLGGRTAPSAMNAQEVDLYVAMPEGLYLYEPEPHQLRLIVHSDARSVTGYQDFVDRAALDLVFVADHRRMMLVPASQRSAYAYAAAGAMSQNVYLFCASEIDSCSMNRALNFVITDCP
ncbi:SagB/ThcOx family dehydrogenase, partial [Roseateles sp. GG27B]